MRIYLFSCIQEWTTEVKCSIHCQVWRVWYGTSACSCLIILTSLCRRGLRRSHIMGRALGLAIQRRSIQVRLYNPRMTMILIEIITENRESSVSVRRPQEARISDSFGYTRSTPGNGSSTTACCEHLAARHYRSTSNCLVNLSWSNRKAARSVGLVVLSFGSTNTFSTLTRSKAAQRECSVVLRYPVCTEECYCI